MLRRRSGEIHTSTRTARNPCRRIRRLHLLPASAPILAAIHDYREALEDYLTEGLDPEVQKAMEEALLHMKFKLAAEASRPKLAVGE